MDEQHEAPARASKKLRALLSAAGFTHRSSGPSQRTMSFDGEYRDWQVLANLNDSWLNVNTSVCALPAELGLRGELLLWMARANARHALVKYSVTKNDRIVIELEVRAERLDADEIRNLVYYLQAKAEEDYLAVLRVASGEKRLDALATTFAATP